MSTKEVLAVCCAAVIAALVEFVILRKFGIK